jgi:hypothetical protein
MNMAIGKDWTRLAGLSVTALVLVGAGWLLLKAGVYGIALFALLPIVLGALAECAWRSKTAAGAAGAGAFTLLAANCGLLALGADGIICIGMSLPLTVPLGAIGGWVAYRARNSEVPSTGTTAFLLLIPLSAGTLGFDVTAKPPVFEVRTSVEIAASPERVWKNVISFSEIPAPDEWFFKAGVAYPEQAHIVGSGVGAVRYCEFSTGPFVEPIQVWDAPRLLRFGVTSNPPPLEEWSPYPNISPKHLHGYMVSEQGEFRLTPLPNGHTLLEGTTRYRHGLWPAQYWRLWSDAIIHRIHRRVLDHIRTLAEAEA